MRPRLAAVLGLLIIGPGIGACVSLKRSPEARFFVLRSLAEAPSAPVVEPARGVVGVLPVQLPGHLERPQVVSWRAPDELSVDEFVRWAEPLDIGTTRTLTENLALLLPEYRVIGRQWPGDTTMRCRVAVELSVFGLQSGGEVVLKGRWALLPERSERPLVMQPVELGGGPLPSGAAGPDPAAGVDGMSRLLADLSRQIAEAIRALPSEPPAAEGEEKGER